MAERMTGDEAIAWLKESGRTPDLSVFWTASDAPGAAERHLKLLSMLFEPSGATDGDILPPHG
jgi:hypothetical protein